MPCWRSALGLCCALLAGCAQYNERELLAVSPIRTQSAACQQYAQAWVEHFRASVAVYEGGHRDAESLKKMAEERLQQAETNEPCHKPYCLIQPRAEGRLDAYCGYKVSDPSGEQLYRWVPWIDLN